MEGNLTFFNVPSTASIAFPTKTSQPKTVWKFELKISRKISASNQREKCA